jgi:hypothetical protein
MTSVQVLELQGLYACADPDPDPHFCRTEVHMEQLWCFRVVMLVLVSVFVLELCALLFVIQFLLCFSCSVFFRKFIYSLLRVF